MSHQNATVSSDMSGSFIEFIIKIFNPDFQKLTLLEQQNIINSFQHFARKAAHFSIYALLGVFTFGFFKTFNKLKMINCVLYSECFALFFAITDEIHQLFIVNRSGQISDVLLDSCGALFGIIIMYLICKFLKVWRQMLYENKK